MAIDLMTHLRSSPSGNLQPSRTTRIKEVGEGDLRQVSSPGGKDLPEDEQGTITVDEANASQAIVELNDYVQRVGRDLHFSMDKDSGKTIIKVFNSETQELIRQIPPEKVFELAEILEQASDITSTGLLEKA